MDLGSCESLVAMDHQQYHEIEVTVPESDFSVYDQGADSDKPIGIVHTV